MRFSQNELWGDRKPTSYATQRVSKDNNKHKTLPGSSLPTPLNHGTQVHEGLYEGYNTQPV